MQTERIKELSTWLKPAVAWGPEESSDKQGPVTPPTGQTSEAQYGMGMFCLTSKVCQHKINPEKHLTVLNSYIRPAIPSYSCYGLNPPPQVLKPTQMHCQTVTWVKKSSIKQNTFKSSHTKRYPHLDHGLAFWSHHLKQDEEETEKVQRMGMGVIRNMERHLKG